GPLRAQILELVKKTRAYELLNLSSLGEFERDFDENCSALYFLLHDLEEHEVVPAGLHVYGMPPLGEDPVGAVADFAARILSNLTMGAVNPERAARICREVIERPETRGSDEPHREAARIVGLLFESARLERENFLRALEGRYVPPGYGGSPFKEVDVLPTGRNSCLFDPRRWPDAISLNAAYVVALPLKMVARKVVAFTFAYDCNNTRALPIAVEMVLMGVIPKRGPDGIVIGVRPLTAPPDALRPGYGQVLVSGVVEELKATEHGFRMIVRPPYGGVRIEVRGPRTALPRGLRVGEEVTILGTAIPLRTEIVLEEARVVPTDPHAITPSELLEIGPAFGHVILRGRVREVRGEWVALTDGRSTVWVHLSTGSVHAGEEVTVEGMVSVRTGGRVVLLASLVLKGTIRRLTDVIVLGTCIFKDHYLHNIRSELFLGRVAAILAAEPYLARELGAASAISTRIVRWSGSVAGLVREHLRRIVTFLEHGRWRNPLHDVVLAAYRRALGLAEVLGDATLAGLLERGLRRLLNAVARDCAETGLDFHSVLETARLLAATVPPSENYPFLDWAAVYLALLAVRTLPTLPHFPEWARQIATVPEDDLSLLAAVNVFCQGPGDYTNVIGKTIESGAFLLEDRVRLAQAYLNGEAYVYGPTRYTSVGFPLLLALNLAAPDLTLHTMASSDEALTFFHDDCIYAFEGGARLIVEAVNGLTPEQEPEIGMLVLNLRHAALGAYTAGDRKRMVKILTEALRLLKSTGASVPDWARDLITIARSGSPAALLLAANLVSTLAAAANTARNALKGRMTAAVRYSLLMPFQYYAWYDLMRTVFNPLYLRSMKFHGASGATEYLKRLGFLIRGWSTLTPALLNWEAIFHRTAEILIANREFFQRYAPESLLSLAVELVTIAYDRAQHGLVSRELLTSPAFVQLVREIIVPELLKGELCCCPAVCGNPAVQQRFLQALSLYETLIPSVRLAELIFRSNYAGQQQALKQALGQAPHTLPTPTLTPAPAPPQPTTPPTSTTSTTPPSAAPSQTAPHPTTSPSATATTPTTTATTAALTQPTVTTTHTVPTTATGPTHPTTPTGRTPGPHPTGAGTTATSGPPRRGISPSPTGRKVARGEVGRGATRGAKTRTTRAVSRASGRATPTTGTARPTANARIVRRSTRVPSVNTPRWIVYVLLTALLLACASSIRWTESLTRGGTQRW
ncbi:MAG: cobaltochelatase subunit CobN, partial [Euryarchaeota archaeon]